LTRDAAMNAISRRIVTQLMLAAVLAATIGCDRVTKRLAVEALAGAPDRSFLGDTVRVIYAENTGGFLSLGAGLSPTGRIAVFVIASGLMLVALLVAAIRERWDTWSMLGVTIFVAGGASNWIDRVVHGRVVDFLNVGIGPLRTGIFNLADVAILAGLALLVLSRWRCRHASPDPA
jgi:signal peptidase II